MRMLMRLSLGLALAALTSGSAYAVPVTFTFDSVAAAGGQFPALANLAGVTQGSGDLTFDASGNLLAGSLTLPTFQVDVDLFGDGRDAIITTTGWTQTLAAGTLTAGTIALTGGTAVGSSACVPDPLTNQFGLLICGSSPTTVSAFGSAPSPQGNVTTLTFTFFNSATDFAGTITSLTSNPASCTPAGTACTQTTARYSFASVPEPSTALLLGAGLLGLGALGRRRV